MAECFIEIVQTERVEDPNTLTDQDAQYAGVTSKQELFDKFTKWYGGPETIKFRNWFVVKQF